MGPDISKIRDLLRYRGENDLVDLLSRASVDYEESNQYGSRLYSMLTTALIRAPVQDYEKLRNLAPWDQHAILRAITDLHPVRDHGIEINSVEFILDSDQPIGDLSDVQILIREIEALRNTMMTVATGGPRINVVTNEFNERRQRVRDQLSRLGLHDPNPHGDLWDWYGKWSTGDLPSYRSRRQYVASIYDPLITKLKDAPSTRSLVVAEPTGWAKVDRQVTEVRRRLGEAANEEQFQSVGLICRETLISLAQSVYDSSRHGSEGSATSNTDAKKMLDSYLGVELGGSTNEAARRHAKAALDLANDLQHRRTATFRQAALCAEATAAVVNILAIVSGQRDPDR